MANTAHGHRSPLRRRQAFAAAIVGYGLICGPPAMAADTPLPMVSCDAPVELFIDRSPLPAAAKAVKERHALTVLAIGSLSTVGVGTGPQTAWPARLEAALHRQLPNSRVTVMNRGRAKSSATDMLKRLPGDVAETGPDLVIWESGTMDAVNNTDVDAYRQTLNTGVGELASKGIDTILMDTQFSRASTAVVDVRPYVTAVQQIADMRDLVVFPRHGLMQYWIESGQLSFDDLKRPVQLRLADQIYDCMGQLLAQMIVDAVARTPN